MKRFLVRSLVQAAACGLAILAAAPASAQSDYPKQPIRMIVGFAPGGISDVLARALAAKVSSQIGQGIIVCKHTDPVRRFSDGPVPCNVKTFSLFANVTYRRELGDQFFRAFVGRSIVDHE